MREGAGVAAQDVGAESVAGDQHDGVDGGAGRFGGPAGSGGRDEGGEEQTQGGVHGVKGFQVSVNDLRLMRDMPWFLGVKGI